MKSWMIGGSAIALLTCTPALGQTFYNSYGEIISQSQYQSQYSPHYPSQYQSQYSPHYQYQSPYQSQYSPQAPTIYGSPSSPAIVIYRNSPYSSRRGFVTNPYRQSVPLYPATSIYGYPSSNRSNSVRLNLNFGGISVPQRSRFSQPYPRQTIYPARYPIGVQTYPIYGGPYRR